MLHGEICERRCRGYVLEIPDYISSKMVSAFLKLKQNLVWRVKLQSPDPGKILTSSWVPQNDILGHKNTKLFVFRCGMNGQYEGMYHAVTTFCLPFENDMPYNAQRGVAKGFGLKADIREVTDIQLLTLLENNKYKKNIQKASNLYKELYSFRNLLCRTSLSGLRRGMFAPCLKETAF
ncbi:UDP-glucuronosyltransferase 2C1-like [Aplysia californica]|uniref:UDP-glucuronosyltransferase 2C1-like n=1 Tax=Aplysia californica TaxID=6500 RepID=A0ABM1A1K4_APLCA|nr:UDP-glucuronosyltransferase 2C1-like [Aplysia californica]